jgi:hypothetical protein
VGARFEKPMFYCIESTNARLWARFSGSNGHPSGAHNFWREARRKSALARSGNFARQGETHERP